MNSIVKYICNNGGHEYDIYYPQNVLKHEYTTSNTTCAWFNDELVVNSRLINYFKTFQDDKTRIDSAEISQSYFFTKDGFLSRNVLSKFNNGKLYSTTELPVLPNNEFHAFYRGLEDCRLVVWDNKLYAYGTRWDRVEGYGCICVYEVGDNGSLMNEIVVKPQNSSGCEKNWGAIEDKPFTFIYLNNPVQIVEINQNGDCWLVDAKKKNDDNDYFIKGSSQVVRYDKDTYVSLVHTNIHEVKNGIKYFNYLTAFVFYDNDLNVIKTSDWFVFKSPMCEFTCGLAIHDEDVYITYSQLDCTSHILKTNKKCIEEFMEYNKTDHNDTYTAFEYYVMAKKNEELNQNISSSVLYNYASLLFNDNNETKLECLIKGFSNIVREAKIFQKHECIVDVKNHLKDYINKYPNCCEFYYLTSYMYRILNDLDKSKEYKEKGDSFKLNMHNYFFKYFNPNYL